MTTYFAVTQFDSELPEQLTLELPDYGEFHQWCWDAHAAGAFIHWAGTLEEAHDAARWEDLRRNRYTCCSPLGCDDKLCVTCFPDPEE